MRASAASSRVARASVRGFTLIELMTVVIILGILTAVAVSKYHQYVVRANRNAAEDVLLGIASAEERYLIDNRAYVATASSVGYPASAFPGNTYANYSFVITPGTGALPSYTITATPTSTGAQANDTACNPLSLASDGTKLPTSCW
ncbi:hypothetical protein HY57_08020 [Dyella japonica A8]|uniref:Pilus assembly protein PilE n=1 Tax=Dyella japonica A8 TaxID=1217721 RepID=A0A075JYR1_9GAMM|nr:hypothetical protein HY57_08020 [Dyella japonica A8]